jgi:CRISPR/Cas system CSM-associated protein Csm4 (group 5 of RAMP superfamily)
MKTGELSEENLKTLKETAWNGFKSDDKGIYIEGRQVKAMLKESANIVKSKVDMTALKARISERVFVVEDRIHLGTDTPSGVHDSVVHAMTAQGPISALKKSDYVNTPTISFTLKVLDEPLVTKTKKNKITPSAYLPLLLNVAAEQGLGADRSQGYGKFSFTCVWEV